MTMVSVRATLAAVTLTLLLAPLGGLALCPCAHAAPASAVEGAHDEECCGPTPDVPAFTACHGCGTTAEEAPGSLPPRIELPGPRPPMVGVLRPPRRLDTLAEAPLRTGVRLPAPPSSPPERLARIQRWRC